MRKRTQAREHALKILYQSELTRREIGVTAGIYWNEYKDVDDLIKDFTTRLINVIEKNLNDIDDKLSAYATNWQLKRMAVIDRNVLRVGVSELLYFEDVPPKVSINESVELAKKYGDLESSKFVNGILDKIHKTELFPEQK